MSAILPTDPKARKNAPIFRGVLRYFPRALAAVAEVSRIGNEQHNPGQEMHWAKGKSTDHGDCIARHLIDAGTFDTDGVRHAAKVAWRALALLETELEDQAIANGIIDEYMRGPTVEETLAEMPVCADCNEHMTPQHVCAAKPIFQGNKESPRGRELQAAYERELARVFPPKQIDVVT